MLELLLIEWLSQMFDVGGGELILIVLAILVLFGPERMPEIARMMKKGMAKVRQAQVEFQNQLEEIQDGLDIENEIKQPFKVSPVVLDDYRKALEGDDSAPAVGNESDNGVPEQEPPTDGGQIAPAKPVPAPARRDVF